MVRSRTNRPVAVLPYSQRSRCHRHPKATLFVESLPPAEEFVEFNLFGSYTGVVESEATSSGAKSFMYMGVTTLLLLAFIYVGRCFYLVFFGYNELYNFGQESSIALLYHPVMTALLTAGSVAAIIVSRTANRQLAPMFLLSLLIYTMFGLYKCCNAIFQFLNGRIEGTAGFASAIVMNILIELTFMGIAYGALRATRNLKEKQVQKYEEIPPVI